MCILISKHSNQLSFSNKQAWDASQSELLFLLFFLVVGLGLPLSGRNQTTEGHCKFIINLFIHLLWVFNGIWLIYNCVYLAARVFVLLSTWIKSFWFGIRYNDYCLRQKLHCTILCEDGLGRSCLLCIFKNSPKHAFSAIKAICDFLYKPCPMYHVASYTQIGDVFNSFGKMFKGISWFSCIL